MLTNRAKYSLKALLYLALLSPGETASGREIAKAGTIPKKFLDLIMGELRAQGVVRSRKGRDGGYALAKPATQIKLGSTVRMMDGPLAPILCASRTAYVPCADCRNVKQCEIRLTMLKVRDAMSDVLDNMSVADLLDSKEPATLLRRPRKPSATATRRPNRTGTLGRRSTALR